MLQTVQQSLHAGTETVTKLKLENIVNGKISKVNCAFVLHFYREMHYSAKHGLAIACRLSVRLSVMLVDHDHVG